MEKRTLASKGVTRSVIYSIVKFGIASGDLNLKNVGDQGKIKKRIGKYFESFSLANTYHISIDHTYSLHKQAKIFHQNGEHLFSLIFYAVFVEHKVNKIILDLLIQKK